MSITTYAQLQTAITSWLGGRTDLTAYYPDWITLFEAVAARKLRLRPMETSTTLTTTSGIVALPSDYLATRRLTWTSSSRSKDLDYLQPSIFWTYYPNTPTANSQSFTIEGGNIKVMPIDDTASALTLDYYAKNSAISSSLNWLFNNHPDVYLFGSLAESADFTDDDTSLAQWKARRDEIFEEIRMVEFRERPPSMSIRVMAFTP